MTNSTVPSRSEIAPGFTWNAPSVFESTEAWETAFNRVSSALADFQRFRGHLGDGPATLLEALEARDDLTRRVGKLLVYARLSHAVDTGDQPALGLYGQAQGLYGQALAAIAFVDSELLAIGEATLRQWIQNEHRLATYEFCISDVFRKQVHVRSAEVEELLGMLEDPFGGAYATANVLTNADFKFRPATASDGSEVPVTQSTIGKILSGSDHQARRTAWESYADTYLAFRTTLATGLATSIKQDVFRMRARCYDSSLEAAFFVPNIPAEVFHNLIDTFRRHLPTWHRYWAIRRKALGVDTLHPYDVWAPLTADSPVVPYELASGVPDQPDRRGCGGGLPCLPEGRQLRVSAGCVEEGRR